MVNSGRIIGLLLFVASPVLFVLYFYLLFFTSFPVLQLTTSLAVLFVFGVLAWIGYTMFTEPSPSTHNSDKVQNVEPETIFPDEAGQDSYVTSLDNLTHSLVVDSEIGEGTEIRDHVNLFKCKVGRNSKIESFVYIEEGVSIGNNCKVKPHTFIPSGVEIEDDVFIGPNTTFTNDKYPRASGEWKLMRTIVKRGSSIGAGSVILPGITIGKGALVGAGSIVSKDVPDDSVVIGNPARVLERHRKSGSMLDATQHET